METTEKPTHAKPSLYAYYFLALKEIAIEYGYNLVLHGSMNRDLDLIAIPWVDDPKPELEMINALCQYLNGWQTEYKIQFLHKILPGGRSSYVINLNRGGYVKNNSGEIIDPIVFVEDPQYYIDISVTPFTKHAIEALRYNGNHYTKYETLILTPELLETLQEEGDDVDLDKKTVNGIPFEFIDKLK